MWPHTLSSTTSSIIFSKSTLHLYPVCVILVRRRFCTEALADPYPGSSARHPPQKQGSSTSGLAGLAFALHVCFGVLLFPVRLCILMSHNARELYRFLF
jgi:hypothetical protein